jgi:hypothetical protein
MATGKALIFSEITISNAGGTSSAATYQLNDMEGIEMTEEALTSEVDARDTIQDALDNGATFITNDDAIASDARVQYGSTIPSTRARVVFTGAAGAATVTYDDVKPSVVKTFDGNRVRYAVTITSRSTASKLVVS